jgi:hypothetical protein
LGEHFILRSQLGVITPIADVAGLLVLLSVSSECFRFRLLCSQNSSLNEGSVMVVLAVSSLAALFEDCHQIM